MHRAVNVGTGYIQVDFGNWRDAIASEHGPSESTTRLVLLVLSLYMNSRRSSCFPSQPTIALRAGLGERSVREHLKLAQADRWIAIQHKSRPGGKRSVREYVATIPAELGRLLEDKLAKCRLANGANSTSQQPAICAEYPANSSGDTGILCHKSRHRLPPNSHSEYGVNTPSEFLRGKNGSERPRESEPDRRHAKAALQAIRERLDRGRSQGFAEEPA